MDRWDVRCRNSIGEGFALPRLEVRQSLVGRGRHGSTGQGQDSRASTCHEHPFAWVRSGTLGTPIVLNTYKQRLSYHHSNLALNTSSRIVPTVISSSLFLDPHSLSSSLFIQNI